MNCHLHVQALVARAVGLCDGAQSRGSAYLFGHPAWHRSAMGPDKQMDIGVHWINKSRSEDHNAGRIPALEARSEVAESAIILGRRRAKRFADFFWALNSDPKVT